MIKHVFLRGDLRLWSHRGRDQGVRAAFKSERAESLFPCMLWGGEARRRDVDRRKSIRCYAWRRQWMVISGGQLILTSTMDEPAPVEV